MGSSNSGLLLLCIVKLFSEALALSRKEALHTIRKYFEIFMKVQ